MNTGKPVQICSPDDTKGGFVFHRQAICEIFSQDNVVDTPVAIYSLAGDFRKGKSFMLNLFLRHLQNDMAKDSLKRNEDDISGFETMGGFQTCTHGIWIWDQPFFAKRNDSQSIAIFLMDTQGIFDQENSTKGSSVVFSLSTLISSVQIYNIMHQVQGSDLQHLQLFVEYGKIAQRRENGMCGTPFQISNLHEWSKTRFYDLVFNVFQRGGLPTTKSLMFLVRDWRYYGEFNYGLEGGGEYLKNVLKGQSQIKEVQEVRTSIKDSFETIECVLLPYPGDKIGKRQKDDPAVSLKVADDDFVVSTQSLVNHLFTDNLKKKQVNGNDITGNGLIFLFGAYCDAFQSDIMPEIGTIVEASAKACLVALRGKMGEEYNTNMSKLCGEGPMPPEELQEHHNRIKSEILQKFDQKPKMGTSDLTRRYKEDLGTLLDEQTKLFVEMNSANQHAKETKEEMAKILQEFGEAQKEQENLYRNRMSENDANIKTLQQDYQNLLGNVQHRRNNKKCST